MTDRREPDDRISAYLDGELSPEEHREITARIASNDDWRVAYEEIAAVRTRLRAAPAPVAPAGFWADVAVQVGAHDAVARADERLESNASLTAAADVDDVVVALTSRPRRSGGWVRWVGGGAAVAATFALFAVIAWGALPASEPAQLAGTRTPPEGGFAEFFHDVRREGLPTTEVAGARGVSAAPGSSAPPVATTRVFVHPGLADTYEEYLAPFHW